MNDFIISNIYDLVGLFIFIFSPVPGYLIYIKVKGGDDNA